MDVHMLSNYILFGNCKSSWDQGEIVSWIMQNMSFSQLYLSALVTELEHFLIFPHDRC